MLYIGNDQDYNNNQLCSGSPFMTVDPVGSNGWYWDERTESGRSPGYVWTFGVEAWCNQEG